MKNDALGLVDAGRLIIGHEIDLEDEITEEIVVPKTHWTRAEIDQLLRDNDLAVERGIVSLFKLQTQNEQHAGTTQILNERGFSSAHARVGTRFARFVLGMNDNNEIKYPPKSLSHEKAAQIFKRYIEKTGSVIERAREICLIHSQQLTDLANGKER